MQGAFLRHAHMEGAILIRANMAGTNLKHTHLEAAVFDYSMLTGTVAELNDLTKANLHGSLNRGGMLRYVNLKRARFDRYTDFRDVFLDGSVNMSAEFRAQMGDPCQWVQEVLDDEKFYRHWRGWVETRQPLKKENHWEEFAPEEYHHVDPISPPPGCGWKSNLGPNLGGP